MRFRFTIRDLLWLTLVVAVLIAWWLDRSELSKLTFPYKSGSFARDYAGPPDKGP